MNTELSIGLDEFEQYEYHNTQKETEIIFGVNDQITFTYTKKSSFTLNEWPFDQQGFLIINVAVGGKLGGSVNTQDISSMKMYVDYVSVYQ